MIKVVLFERRDIVISIGIRFPPLKFSVVLFFKNVPHGFSSCTFWG